MGPAHDGGADGGSDDGGLETYPEGQCINGWISRSVFGSPGKAVDVVLDPLGTAHAIYSDHDIGPTPIIDVTDDPSPTKTQVSKQYINTSAAAAGSDGSLYAVGVESHPTSGPLYEYELKAGSWQETPIGAQALQTDAQALYFDGTSSRIAVDPSGTPHVIFLADDGNDGALLRYATIQGGTWVTSTIKALAAMRTPWLAVDAAGHNHVLASGDLEYATDAGGSWSFESVAADATSRLLLDGAGTPHILSSGTHQWKTASGWQTETIPRPNESPTKIAFAAAIDANGTLYAAYELQTKPVATLMIVTNKSGSWTATTTGFPGENELVRQPAFSQIRAWGPLTLLIDKLDRLRLFPAVAYNYGRPQQSFTWEVQPCP